MPCYPAYDSDDYLQTLRSFHHPMSEDFWFVCILSRLNHCERILNLILHQWCCTEVERFDVKPWLRLHTKVHLNDLENEKSVSYRWPFNQLFRRCLMIPKSTIVTSGSYSDNYARYTLELHDYSICSLGPLSNCQYYSLRSFGNIYRLDTRVAAVFSGSVAWFLITHRQCVLLLSIQWHFDTRITDSEISIYVVILRAGL